MKNIFVLIVSVLIFALIFGVSSQRSGRFIVDVAFEDNARVTLCLGTIITENHVLVPASCVNGPESFGVTLRGGGNDIEFGKC
jgi:hypothetical protein